MQTQAQSTPQPNRNLSQNLSLRERYERFLAEADPETKHKQMSILVWLAALPERLHSARGFAREVIAQRIDELSPELWAAGFGTQHMSMAEAYLLRAKWEVTKERAGTISLSDFFPETITCSREEFHAVFRRGVKAGEEHARLKLKAEHAEHKISDVVRTLAQELADERLKRVEMSKVMQSMEKALKNAQESQERLRIKVWEAERAEKSESGIDVLLASEKSAPTTTREQRNK